MIINGYEGLELSTQILIRDAINRGLELEVIDWHDNFIRIKKNNKIEYIKQATKTSLDTYIAPLIMENKEVTKLILKENSINVPYGVTINTLSEAEENYGLFRGRDIVVKPKSTNFGKGVIIIKSLKSRKELLNAVRIAFEHDTAVIIEQFIPGREYRFLVIGDEVPAILHRVPANVTGDGINSIENLVIEKNKNPLRGTGYVTPLEKIRLGETEKDFLALQGKDIKYIPSEGEVVYLRENSNISTGGDSIDFTDDIRQEYKTIAINATKAVGAKICGADIIIKDIKEPPAVDNYCIIELNFNPALHIHNYPYQGRNRDVGNRVLDLLGF